MTADRNATERLPLNYAALPMLGVLYAGGDPDAFGLEVRQMASPHVGVLDLLVQNELASIEPGDGDTFWYKLTDAGRAVAAALDDLHILRTR